MEKLPIMPRVRRSAQGVGARGDASRRAAGNCYDNAVAESFFATLKKELVHGRAFETR
jgi:transposase InsO family protein